MYPAQYTNKHNLNSHLEGMKVAQ